MYVRIYCEISLNRIFSFSLRPVLPYVQKYTTITPSSISIFPMFRLPHVRVCIIYICVYIYIIFWILWFCQQLLWLLIASSVSVWFVFAFISIWAPYCTRSVAVNAMLIFANCRIGRDRINSLKHETRLKLDEGVYNESALVSNTIHNRIHKGILVLMRSEI